MFNSDGHFPAFQHLTWRLLSHISHYSDIWASQVALVLKTSPASAETWEVWAPSLGREGPLEVDVASFSSNPALRIPGTEQVGRLQSIGSRRVRLELLSRDARGWMRVSTWCVRAAASCVKPPHQLCEAGTPLWKPACLWGSQRTVQSSSPDGSARPPYLPSEKPVCRSGSNSQNRTWDSRLVLNRKRNASRLCIVTPLI